MKVSYQWLTDYVDMAGVSAEDLAEKITRSGVEVDQVESRNKGVTGVVVGHVVTREQHPNADKLSVCTVDTGSEQLQIVCGAPNVAAGQKVPVALIGAQLPDDFRIKRAKLRGVESQGMICSAKELGMNDRLLPKEIQEGILVLPEDTPVGTDILDLLSLNDQVLELDLTPNRSDCLSMRGMAYEVAAILGTEVNWVVPANELVEEGTAAADHIQVKISAEDQCTQYAARYIDQVQVGPSPLWLQNRLMAAGVRPINNVVDITNYVMLEYGQPLHAFDYDRLNEGRIDVRMAHNGEKLLTLDGVERVLHPDMMVITDGHRPIALAGVMGGADSEVTATTTRILLEAACFDGGSVRKTSRQLGLRSEASLRFEKEVDPQAVIEALDRAAVLLQRYAGGRVAPGVVQQQTMQSELVTLELKLDRVNQYLGTNLSAQQIEQIFARLHFPCETVQGQFRVTVPSRRGDIAREVDLIEEIARLYGYEHIPLTLMSGVTTPGSLSTSQSIRRELRNLLADNGLHEAVTYSFTSSRQQAEFSGLYPQAQPIALAMPMSEERSVLRTSLVPHLIDVAVYNRNRNIDDVAIFEMGSVYIVDEPKLTGLPEEKRLLSILLTGHRHDVHWAQPAREVDYYDLKGIFETIAAHFGLEGIQYHRVAPDGYHPGRTAEITVESNNEAIILGWIGQLHPELQRLKDLANTYVLEIDLNKLIECANLQIAYHALPRYPSISRDIALVVDEHIAASELKDCATQSAGELLESVRIFDVYTGDKVDPGKKSVALSLVYRNAERTLTDDEVSEAHQKVVGELEQRLAAQLRK